MDFKSLNHIENIFILLAAVTGLLGGLIGFLEPLLPNFIVQTYCYGKHSFKGKANAFVTKQEVPKSWFKHFYIFALLWSTACAYYTIRIYCFDNHVPREIISLLDFLCGSQRRATVSRAEVLLAVCLLTLQCWRRFYETHFVQIFSSGKINVAHYLIGYFHYFGCIVIVMAQAPVFAPMTASSVSSQNAVICLLSALLFLYAWYHQFESNKILANLRQNESGKVVTTKHLMPTGGFFEQISSPHMLFEIVLYVALYGILYKNTSWIYVLAWVAVNQTSTALIGHSWYKKTFKNYPKNRKALIPNVL